MPPGAELDLAQSHCLLALAELQLEVQDFSGAATQVREALRHCGEAPSRSDRLRFDLAIVEGTLRFIAGDWSDALRAYGHATTLAHRHGSPVEALLGHLPAAATLYLSGHGSLVEQQLAHALAVAESLPGAPTLRLFVTELPLNFVGRAGIAGMIERGRRLLDDAESARNHRFLPLTVAWIAALCGGSGEREKARLVVETTHQTIAAKGQLTPAMRELAGRIARDWPR